MRPTSTRRRWRPTEVTRGLGLTVAADTNVYVRYTQTGTAATAGVATIIVEYIPNNDQ